MELLTFARKSSLVGSEDPEAADRGGVVHPDGRKAELLNEIQSVFFAWSYCSDGLEGLAAASAAEASQHHQTVAALCDAVEGAMTECLSISQLMPYVNTEGVGTLLRTRRSESAAFTHTPSVVGDDALLVGSSIKDLAQAAGVCNEALNLLATPPLSLCPSCRRANDIVAAGLQQFVAATSSPKRDGLVVITTLWPTTTISALLSASGCLCLTDEAIRHGDGTLQCLRRALDSLCDALESLVGAAKAQEEAHRLATARWERNRLELERLQCWYMGCLDAHRHWQRECERRQKFKASLRDALQDLAGRMNDEANRREVFADRFGAFLPLEGFPDLGKPPSPIQVLLKS